MLLMKRNPSCSQFLTRGKKQSKEEVQAIFLLQWGFLYDKVHIALRTKATQSAWVSPSFFRNSSLKLLPSSQQKPLSVSKCWMKLENQEKANFMVIFSHFPKTSVSKLAASTLPHQKKWLYERKIFCSKNGEIQGQFAQRGCGISILENSDRHSTDLPHLMGICLD